MREILIYTDDCIIEYGCRVVFGSKIVNGKVEILRGEKYRDIGGFYTHKSSKCKMALLWWWDRC